MFVEELQGSLLLLDSDELLGAFAAAALAWCGRRWGCVWVWWVWAWWWAGAGGRAAYRVFSGLLCGGGAMLGSGGP